MQAVTPTPPHTAMDGRPPPHHTPVGRGPSPLPRRGWTLWPLHRAEASASSSCSGAGLADNQAPSEERCLSVNRESVAGSGLATTEMRIVMINIVDAALAQHPSVTPTLFVDDLSSEKEGSDD